MSDQLHQEYSMQDTIECKQYPEYNNVFISNEFAISYEELNENAKDAPKRASGIPRKAGRYLKVIVSTVATAGVVTAAVLLSLIVQVTSFAKGSDFLSFTFHLVNPEEIGLIASLADGNEQPLYEDGQTLIFEQLQPNTTYTLKVIRVDNGSVLFEKTYRTLDGPVRQTFSVLPADTYATWNSVEVLLSYEGTLPKTLSASMNGLPCRVAADEENGMIRLRGEGFTEYTDVSWELRDSDGGILSEGVCRTVVGPDAAALGDQPAAAPHAIRINLRLDNPCGHPLTARLNGQAYELPADTQAEAVIEAFDLDEQSSYICTVTDNVTGNVILETEIRTPPEPSASAEPVGSHTDYFGFELELNVDDEFGHPMSATIDGAPVELERDGRSIRVKPDGLSEDTDYTVEVLDEHTGEIIYRETVHTTATPPAVVTLTSHEEDYFSLDLLFAVDNPYGHDLSIRLDDLESEAFTNEAVRYDGLAEHSDHTVTIRDERTGTDIWTDSFRTKDAGSVSVTLRSSDVGYFGAGLSFDIRNPAGHSLTAFADGAQIPFDTDGASGRIILEDLAEQTTHDISIQDEATGDTVWSGSITTPATPPADVTLATADLTYFGMDLTFAVENPFGHPLTVRLDDGIPAPLSDSYPRVTYDGLDENSRHTITVTDTFTGTDVWTDTLITLNAGDVQVLLKDSTVNYFDAALTFAFTNPANHKLTAYQGTAVKTLMVNGSTGTMSLTGLAEKTAYTIRIVDEFTGATVYTGTVTTKATPAATVTLASQNVGYFNIDLTFTISNPYNHNLTVALDNGTAKALTSTVSYTGLAENSSHTVTVKDVNTGTTVYTGTFTTASAGDTKVTLTNSTVNYFDAALTFAITNPAGHKLTAYQGTTPKTLTLNGSTGTMSLTGLAEKTAYTIRIVDEFTGATVYTGNVTTQETPAATVTLQSSTVTCYDVSLNFIVTNPNNHELQLTVDGSDRAFRTSVPIGGLEPMSKHTVSVKDVNPVTGTVKTVYTGTFTTECPVTITQDPDGKVHYRYEDDFFARYSGQYMYLVMTAKNPINADFEHIYFGDKEQTVSGSARGIFFYKGDYTVEIWLENSILFSFDHTLTYGLSDCKLKASISGSVCTFTVVSGELPSLFADDSVKVWMYTADGLMQEFTSGTDFTYSPNGFSIRLDMNPTYIFNPTEFQVELLRYNPEWYEHEGMMLDMGSVS